MVRAQAGVDRQIGNVTAGETVTFYIRNCTTDAAGNPIPIDDADRKVKIKIVYGCSNDTDEQEISEEGSMTAQHTGTMYVTGVDGNPEVQVCLTLERDGVPTACDCDLPLTGDPPNEVRGLNLDPDPQLPNQNVRVRRFSSDPGTRWQWNDGYPACLFDQPPQQGDRNGQIMWVEDFYSANFNDGVTAGSTSKILYRLFKCENGVVTEVDKSTAGTANPETTTSCQIGGNPIVIVHPDGTDWSVSSILEAADPVGSCDSVAGFNAYGLVQDIPDLPDKVDFECDGVPIQVRHNPLP